MLIAQKGMTLVSKLKDFRYLKREKRTLVLLKRYSKPLLQINAMNYFLPETYLIFGILKRYY